MRQQESKVFDDVLLSTDSEQIAAAGERYGATVPGLRPEHLAADDSDQFDTHPYIFEKLGITDETHRVCILCNNSFIDARLIKEGYAEAARHDFERIVLDSIQVGGDYVYYRQCIQEAGRLRLRFPDAMRASGINRQTIAPLYTSINNIRWANPSILTSYEAYKNEITDNGFLPIWLLKSRNFDIDDAQDWVIAEAVFQALLTRHRVNGLSSGLYFRHRNQVGI